MKQLICTLFIVLQLSAFSISAHSFEVDGLFYNIVDREVDSYMDNNVEVTFDQEKHTNKLGSYSGEINIPGMVTYNGTDYCVVGIGNEAFRYSNNLESIEYPSTIRYIGTSAFEGCEKVPLAPIIIASDDETHNTSIPSSVTYIGERAFAESGLEEVYCDDLSCAPAAFKDCKRLKTVAIHMSSIPSECFAGCSNLENLSNSFSKYIGEYAFAGCSSLTNNYVIMGYGLEDIDQYAFDGCTSLDRIDIPASVRSIGSYAFSRCTGLIEVYLNGVTLYNSGPKYCYKDLLFYDNVFNGCSSITSVHIGRRMVSDYKGTLTDPFRGLTLTSVRFTDFALETAFNGADYPELSSISSCTPIPPIIAGFTDSQYKTISIGIPSEYRAAYQQNSIWQKFSKMGSVSLASACIVEHDGLYYVTTWLGTDAMVIHNPYGKKYEKSSYTISEFEFNGSKCIPKGINDCAFADCTGVKSITFSENDIRIGNAAFENSGLTSVDLSKGTTALDMGVAAFANCKDLETVILPEEYTELRIPKLAFSGCEKLLRINFSPELLGVEEDAFSGCKSLPATLSFGDCEYIHLSGNAFSGCSIENLILPTSCYVDPDVATNQLPFSNNPLKNVTVGYLETSVPLFANESTQGNKDIETLTIKGDVYYFYWNNVGQNDKRTWLTDGKINRIILDFSDCRYPSANWLDKSWDVNIIESYQKNPPTIGYFTDNQYKRIKVFVPRGALDAYKADPSWREFLNVEEADFDDAIPNVISDSCDCQSVIGGIQLTAAKPTNYNVYSVDGSLLTSGQVSTGSIVIPMVSGVYFVKLGDASYKLYIN